jgi:peptide/nickel transport system permease protein
VKRLAAATTLGLLLVALGADLLASDLPLVAQVGGETVWFPCVTRPTGFNPGAVQWQLRTPIPYGPNQTLAVTGEVHDLPPPWAPDASHWLGTDELGRDVGARLVHGARVSLFIGLFTVVIAVVVGLLVGGFAGYLGGVTDAVLSRVLEVMTTFPLLFFLIALLSLLRTQSLLPLVLTLGLTRWTDVARLVRAEVLSLKVRPFVAAARAMGASRAYIVVRHLLPNALGPVVVSATFGVAGAILLESALSFLGIGVAPPTASWGELLNEAHHTLVTPGAWWLALFPGLAIAATVLAINGLGAWFERTFDEPR